MVRPVVHRSADPGALAAAAASLLADRIAHVIDRRGACRLALAGGSTPRPVYERWAGYRTGRIEWGRVELFWGDERCVPADHPASNYRMVQEALLRHVPVAAAQVHRIRGELPAAGAARDYEQQLAGEPLDIVLLGMGEDGHTASIFPGGPELEAAGSVVPSLSPEPPHDRVTLTLRALNASGAVFLLVAGAGKTARLAQAFGEIAAGAPGLPVARVQPASGELHWCADEAAARQLPEPAPE